MNVEMSLDQFRGMGFKPRIRLVDSKVFPKDTWRYERGDSEVCLAVEVDLKTIRPIRYVNLQTGETGGYY